MSGRATWRRCCFFFLCENFIQQSLSNFEESDAEIEILQKLREVLQRVLKFRRQIQDDFFKISVETTQSLDQLNR